MGLDLLLCPFSLFSPALVHLAPHSSGVLLDRVLPANLMRGIRETVNHRCDLVLYFILSLTASVVLHHKCHISPSVNRGISSEASGTRAKMYSPELSPEPNEARYALLLFCGFKGDFSVCTSTGNPCLSKARCFSQYYNVRQFISQSRLLTATLSASPWFCCVFHSDRMGQYHRKQLCPITLSLQGCFP